MGALRGTPGGGMMQLDLTRLSMGKDTQWALSRRMSKWRLLTFAALVMTVFSAVFTVLAALAFHSMWFAVLMSVCTMGFLAEFVFAVRKWSQTVAMLYTAQQQGRP